MFQRLLSEPRPRVIFIASLNYYTSDNTYLANGWKKTLRALRAIGAPIVYLHDTPYPNYEFPLAFQVRSMTGASVRSSEMSLSIRTRSCQEQRHRTGWQPG